jgi:hypothetical protein
MSPLHKQHHLRLFDHIIHAQKAGLPDGNELFNQSSSPFHTVHIMICLQNSKHQFGIKDDEND